MEFAAAEDEAGASQYSTGKRRGFSIVEVTIVLTIMAVMLGIALPSFMRAVEKAKADIAIANLRAVWAAEQFYWVENRTFTSDFDTLNAYHLIPPDVMPAQQNVSPPPAYAFTFVDDLATGFSIKAQRTSGSVLTDYFQIDQTGTVTGSITLSDGYVIQAPTAY